MDKSNKFPHLLEFLQVERDALEYATSDIRNTFRRGNVNVLGESTDEKEKGHGCVFHKSNGHITEHCRSFLGMTVSDR